MKNIIKVAIVVLAAAAPAYAQEAPEFPPPKFEQPVLVLSQPAPPPAEAGPEGEQVVLRFAAERSNGRIFQVEAITQLRLIPVAGEYPAPLNHGDASICRPYQQGPRMMVRCGSDHYILVGVAFVEKRVKQ